MINQKMPFVIKNSQEKNFSEISEKY